MIKSNEWLEKNYPKNGICQLDDSFKNKGKKRSEIIELDISNKNFDRELIGHLDLSGFVNLEFLDCSYNKIISLKISDCLKLKKLNCTNNQLSEINISNNSQLSELYFSSNLLSWLDLSKNNKLEKLDIKNNNFPSQNPFWLSNLVNLKNLNISQNNFIGSLEFVKDMNNLEHLDISDGNNYADDNNKIKFINGLEYLPRKLKTILCNGKIKEDIKSYDNNLFLWQSLHPQLMKEAGKELITLDYSQSESIKAITTPYFSKKEISKKTKLIINYSPNLNYSSFLLRDPRPFSWGFNLIKILPIRLYHVPTDQVIESELIPTHSKYAILSYVWGDLADKKNLTTWDYIYQDKNGVVTPKQLGVNAQFDATGTTRESIKALQKAKMALTFLNQAHQSNIDYLWMDQMCINQFDHEEQGQEVTKMRQYYSNAAATLIAIDAEIGELDKDDEIVIAKTSIIKIVNSSWFSRSWCFQEGLLSKQTIFMFDDYLVDGRLLALVWNGWKEESDYLQMNENLQIFITPLGWSYGARLEQDIDLTLSEALLSVKNRSQSVPVDGIYSILGLLPYGKEVKVEYKDKICSKCKKKEEERNKSIDCSHSNKIEWAKYFIENLEEALKKVVEKSFSKGYKNEIFSWTGDRSMNYWYLPKINENGSTCIEVLINYQLEDIGTSLNEIKLIGQYDRIKEVTSYSDEQFVRTGRYSSELSYYNYKVQVNDSLLIIGSNKETSRLLAVLIPNDINRSIDLMEMWWNSLDLEKKIEMRNIWIYQDPVERKLFTQIEINDNFGT